MATSTEHAPPPRRKRRYAVVRAVAAGLVAVALFVVVLRGAEFERAMGVLKGLGFLLPLALLPNVVITLLEAFGFRLAFQGVGARPTLRGLISVRLVADAVALSVPSGSLVTEALQPYLFHRRAGLSYGEAVAGMVARKMLAVGAHGLFLAMALAVAYPAVERASAHMFRREAVLPVVLVVAAVALMLASLLLATAASRGRMGGRLLRGLQRLPLGSLRHRLERSGPSLLATDERLAAWLSAGPRALLVRLPWFLLIWVARAAENLVLLRMVGVQVGFRDLLVLEPSLLVVRATLSLLPAGLGVQDFGCLLYLEALGVEHASVAGAAYVLLRRGKELFWVAVGYAVLLAHRPNRASAP